ncbi:MAG TPA: alpha/beta hydrolase [Nitrososphaeraceae archaeon]|nr:alpha/beta hydrolase [Nitrososphaeraceae archaeon]
MQQKEKVHFQSEGLKVVGTLFRPQNSKEEEVSLPAILVAGAMSGVKEQVAGQYAERIAKDGYVTLVLDHRHFGESEGEPRQHEYPAKKLEDFKSAISFISSLKGIDRERIGACGISMGGGYMLQLAAFDRRIKSVSIVASGLNLADTLLEILGKEGFVNFLKEFNNARQRHYDTGEVQYIPAVATDNKPAAMIGDEPFEYYGTSRAWSPGWVNRYTTESIENLMSYNAIPYARHVSPTPLLIIHGKNDKYCLPKFAQEVYDLADEPKEILWLDTSNHIDLYDNEKYVGPAISKIVEWFNKYLRQG